MDLDITILQEAYRKKGYHFFLGGEYNLNIFGIRSVSSRSNKFDDTLGVAYFDELGQGIVEAWPATTDPGKHWLKNPLNKNGTLIMVPGQYKGAYRLGLHGRTSQFGPYEALEQCKPMKYVRDNNKDEVLNFELYRDPALLRNNLIEGIYKSNIHRASKWKIVKLVERYSAGCQVIQSPEHFEELIDLVKSSIQEGWPNSFTYTLFEQHDFV